MKYELVIFDLDGTLLDTLDDLAAACNFALRQAGFPERTREQVRLSIGNGVANLMRRSAPEGTSEETQAKLLSDFRARYAGHVNDLTRPYPGITALLYALREAGVRTAVNSNKPDAATQALCKAHFEGCLDAVMGEQADVPRKPSPEGAHRLMALLKAAPERTLYVGDSDTDLMTARNAGIDAAWVSWGYRGRGELGDVAVAHAFDSADALERFILEE